MVDAVIGGRVARHGAPGVARAGTTVSPVRAELHPVGARLAAARIAAAIARAAAAIAAPVAEPRAVRHARRAGRVTGAAAPIADPTALAGAVRYARRLADPTAGRVPAIAGDAALAFGAGRGAMGHGRATGAAALERPAGAARRFAARPRFVLATLGLVMATLGQARSGLTAQRQSPDGDTGQATQDLTSPADVAEGSHEPIKAIRIHLTTLRVQVLHRRVQMPAGVPTTSAQAGGAGSAIAAQAIRSCYAPDGSLSEAVTTMGRARAGRIYRK